MAKRRHRSSRSQQPHALGPVDQPDPLPGPYDMGGGIIIDRRFTVVITPEDASRLFWERLRDDAREKARRQKGGEATAELRQQKAGGDRKAFLAIRDNSGLTQMAAARVYLRKNDPNWHTCTHEEQLTKVASFLRRMRRHTPPKKDSGR